MIQFKHSSVLIPVDFSKTSLLAIKHGAFFASLTKADLYLVHVINSNFGSQNLFLPIVTLEDNTEIEKKALDKLNELAQEITEEHGVKPISIVRMGSASKVISEVAKEINASIIVMGTHGHAPLEELVIGSTALKVFTKSPCPTMAMNSGAKHKGYQKIILPIDTTANTKQKVNYALDFAKKFVSSLHVLALLDSDEETDAPAMEVIVQQIQKLAQEKGVSFHADILKNVDNRAKATVKFCEEQGGDLIIIMTDQDSELSGFFLGPYSQQIIHYSKVPVLAIKPKDLYTSSGLSGLPGSSGN